MKLCNVEVHNYACWKEVPESSTLILILDTATRKLLRLSFRQRCFPPPVDYHCFLTQRSPAPEVFQWPFYTKSTWSAQTSFISGLNILEIFSSRKRAHMLHSAITSGRKTVTGTWDIGVTSQEYSNHLQKTNNLKVDLDSRQEILQSVHFYSSVLVMCFQSHMLFITEVNLACGTSY